jgi:hypothetical protein
MISWLIVAKFGHITKGYLTKMIGYFYNSVNVIKNASPI